MDASIAKNLSSWTCGISWFLLEELKSPCGYFLTPLPRWGPVGLRSVLQPLKVACYKENELQRWTQLGSSPTSTEC